MQNININGKSFKKVIDHKILSDACHKIADKINIDFADKNPLFLVVLNGAFMFAADLMKLVNIPCNISFVKYSSYHGTKSTGCVKELIGLNENIENRTVVIIEDLVDTGLSMYYLFNNLEKKSPKEIKLVAMFDKPIARQKNVSIDYCGITLPDKFIVGYGLDFDEKGRNLSDVYELDKD